MTDAEMIIVPLKEAYEKRDLAAVERLGTELGNVIARMVMEGRTDDLVTFVDNVARATGIDLSSVIHTNT